MENEIQIEFLITLYICCYMCDMPLDVYGAGCQKKASSGYVFDLNSVLLLFIKR